jgi:hypothetical protein
MAYLFHAKRMQLLSAALQGSVVASDTNDCEDYNEY